MRSIGRSTIDKFSFLSESQALKKTHKKEWIVSFDIFCRYNI